MSAAVVQPHVSSIGRALPYAGRRSCFADGLGRSFRQQAGVSKQHVYMQGGTAKSLVDTSPLELKDKGLRLFH